VSSAQDTEALKRGTLSLYAEDFRRDPSAEEAACFVAILILSGEIVVEGGDLEVELTFLADDIGKSWSVDADLVYAALVDERDAILRSGR